MQLFKMIDISHNLSYAVHLVGSCVWKTLYIWAIHVTYLDGNIFARHKGGNKMVLANTELIHNFSRHCRSQFMSLKIEIIASYITSRHWDGAKS